MKEIRAVSVIGLGKLGAPMVACVASKGYWAIGVDTNPRNVRLIDEAKATHFEPGLDEMLRDNAARVSATEDFGQAVAESDITFIVVPTPSEPGGSFSTEYVVAAGEEIGEALKRKQGYHLVVLTSTVLPGATEADLKPVLEARSGKKCGADFGLCYSPEFIALGSVIRDMLNPDFLLVGEWDRRSGDVLSEFYGTLCDSDPPMARMNIVNAELAKISVNSYVTMKISFANNLAEICEGLPGADANVVTSAIGLDSRIGRKYIKAALGYGGPCFPRDNRAFGCAARHASAAASLAEATDAVNERQLVRLADIVSSRIPEGGVVGVLGLSYKPDTDVVEESQGLALAQSLAESGHPTVVYDPAAMDNARRVTGGAVTFAASMEECVRQANVIVIATPWPQFRDISPEAFRRDGPRAILVDCWRMLDPCRVGEFVECVRLGQGGAQAACKCRNEVRK